MYLLFHDQLKEPLEQYFEVYRFVITTIKVTTAADVRTVQVIVAEGTLKEVTHIGDAQSPFTFVYTGLGENSELEIRALDGKGKTLQTIYKKIGKGSKTYNEIPKKNLAVMSISRGK